MNLREFLESAETFIDYYIGAKEGGSFFYIGPPDKALNDIIFIQHKAYKDVKATRFRSKLEIARLKAEEPKPSELEAYKKLLKKKKDNLKILNDRVKDWTPLFDREVLEVTPRVTGGVKVIVDGFCSGNYWSISEYDKTRKDESPKMDIHPTGVEELRAAILEQAVDDYQKTLKHKREKGSEPGNQMLTSNSLKTFFRSNWFESLCNLDGKAVIRMIEKEEAANG